jgi:hypothetical protein
MINRDPLTAASGQPICDARHADASRDQIEELISMEGSAAELFLRYDYTETKDLAKAFLTLVSSILVISITFSEKMVGGQSANRRSRLALSSCWLFLIISIIICGFALVLITIAAGEAIYGGTSYLSMASRAWYLMIGAGTLFALGLLSLAIAGIFSLYDKTS